MEWQPIGTAPEDTTVLVFLEGDIYQAHKSPRGNYWIFPYSAYHGCGWGGEITDSPTHWMPLLEPPVAETEDT